MRQKMRYKLVGLVLVLLLATPVYSQEELPPIGIDLLLPVPTVVKTAEPFTVSYRVRYLDLTAWKKEIILFTEKLTVEELQGWASPFKVLAVELKELVYRDGEYWQDIKITLMIVDKERGAKKVPKFILGWAKKEAGKEEGELKPEIPSLESPE